MAEKIRKKEISPVESVDAHLTKIAKLESNIKCICSSRYRPGTASRAECGFRRNESSNARPLHGVPISIKSSFGVEGLRCEAGTRLRAGFVARQDAVLVTRLKNAGAIILGLTNTPELLMAWETDNLLYGRTNSPWDLERTPAVPVVEKPRRLLLPVAGGVGSDGGGSIRVPAHFSGICGLKPTPGRIPATGHFPVSAGRLLPSVSSSMARTLPI